MCEVWYFILLSLFIHNVRTLTLQNDATIVPPGLGHSLPDNDKCDPSTIPVMEKFDMKQFSGEWYELSKSASGYIDVNDGMWKIQTTNTSSTFLFSGRDVDTHCIRPIKGKIHTSDQPPGTLTLHYKTYSNHVEETIRVLFTDYTTIAVIYKCVYHVHREREICHPAGFVGAVWTREPHVQLHVYESAVKYLEMACVHKSVLMIRNQIGSCDLDDTSFDIDDFPVPDLCYKPVDLGFCRGNVQRFFYNAQTKNCEMFIYNGCGGNRNNFMSLSECQEKCLTVSPKEMVCLSSASCAMHCPPCCSKDTNGCVQCSCEQVMHDDSIICMKTPGYCQPECAVEEIYASCYVCRCSDDELLEISRDEPACIEAKAEGNCQGQVERYYYDAILGECEKFIYSGCKGNKNNFETMKECHEKCIGLYKAEESDPDSATEIKFNVWIIGSLLALLTIVHIRS